jgi:hypothetical protein
LTTAKDEIPFGDGKGHFIESKDGDIITPHCGIVFRARIIGMEVWEDRDREVCVPCLQTLIELAGCSQPIFMQSESEYALIWEKNSE